MIFIYFYGRRTIVKGMR